MKKMKTITSVVGIFLIIMIMEVEESEATGMGAKHHFTDGEKVDLWANYIGPFSNPSETYQFYNLPFCQPKKYERRHQRLGQVISGDRSILSEYNLPFKGLFVFFLSLLVFIKLIFLLIFFVIFFNY